MAREAELPIVEEAAEWFARLECDEASEATRAEFSDWLIRSPVHIQEFLSVSAMHRAMAVTLKADPEWLADLLDEASPQNDNVVEMADFAPVEVPPPTRHRSSKRLMLWGAVAAMLIMTLALVATLSLGPIGSERITTAVGEQRWVELDDGSMVHLNTDSEITVRMTRETRYITLLRGEAVFDVEHDPVRPFQVLVDTVLVEAIGTRFNIHRKDGQVVVTVLEGKVVVRQGSSQKVSARVLVAESEEDDEDQPIQAPTPITLRPRAKLAPPRPLVLDTGQQTTVNADGLMVAPAVADTKRVTAWTERRIILDSAPLGSVVTEFNRYNRNHLEIVDPALKSRRITGVFNVDDPDAFLALVESLVDIRTKPQPDGTVRIYRAEP
jgi:transmembrane sensor